MNHRHSTLVLLLAALTVLFAACERPRPLVEQRGYRGLGIEENRNPRTLARQVAANAPPAVIPALPAGDAPRAADVYQNVQVLRDLSLPEFTRVMLAITAWVAPPDQSCGYCHEGEMSADTRYTKRVARRMLSMVRDVNSHWQSHVGATGVTCYTCHRGQPVPAEVWFTGVPAVPHGLLGDRAGQNAPALAAGMSSLPTDPLTPFLVEGRSIRVGSATALPTGDRHSIKETEWTYAFMMNISQSLGVNCTYCHNSRAFRDWDQSNPARAKAWYGIQMARTLNHDYLLPLADTFPANRKGPAGDVAKIGCATCHQGVYKPLFGEQMAKEYPELQGDRTPPPAPAAEPAPAAAATASTR